MSTKLIFEEIGFCKKHAHENDTPVFKVKVFSGDEKKDEMEKCAEDIFKEKFLRQFWVSLI